MAADAVRTVEIKLSGTTCTFETGRIARLCSGAVLGRSGDNVVLATVVEAPPRSAEADFFPLTVEYRERLSAIGRIPGTFNRREGRISDREVLVSRLIDRSVRSLFPDGYTCELQVQVQVLSAEPSSDFVSLALLTACAALHVSPIPHRGPAAGLRICRVDGQWTAFPSARQRQRAEVDFVVSHGPDGLVMVEGEAAEAGEQLCLEALELAAEWLGRARGALLGLRADGAAEPTASQPLPLPALPDDARAALRAACRIESKTARRQAVGDALSAWLATVPDEQQAAARKGHAQAWSEEVRAMVLADAGRRLDGRGAADVRPISGTVGLLPRAHGSALFTRGETQALVVVTLGTGDDAPRVDEFSETGEPDRFLLHYSFPPYSVGEVRPLRGPGRREIGHGNLARRGLHRLLPPFRDFPYTLRVESEISESNGSSSMATVCGGCLALMDAGVPIARPVAGIAMGMIADGERFAILTDILGDEDHLGDMDFKVVGTAAGVTALQLDNKIGGLRAEQLAAALLQARDARLHVLAEMAKVLAEPRAERSPRAPHVERLQVMPTSIGAVVGPRGANIRAIQVATGSRVAIEDDGTVLVYAADGPAARRARRMVQKTAGLVRRGGYYRGTVQGVRDFGAFVRINDVNEGLVPAEELVERPGQRPGDAVQEGDEVVVKVLGTDARGRLRMSVREARGASEESIEF